MVFKKKRQLFSKRKAATLYRSSGNQVLNKLNISGIFLFLFSPKVNWLSSIWMSCLKISNFFWKGQIVVIKAKVMFFSLKFCIQVVEMWHYASQKSNTFHFFIISSKSWKFLSLHILLTSRKKTKIPYGPKSLLTFPFTLSSYIVVHK